MPVSLFAMIFPGSSPLTRGTHDTLLDLANYCRFIPAYAGNSRYVTRSRELLPVHPRLRGELLRNMRPTIEAVGSSPLTRGTLTTTWSLLIPVRFIPAYAGNSSPENKIVFPTSVHPRLRGELFIVGVNVKSRVGSSPLTRGTLFWDFIEEVDERFIPAYAGNSPVYSVPGLVDHGSSPLTRGTHFY